jgi:hypothetical protein
VPVTRSRGREQFWAPLTVIVALDDDLEPSVARVSVVGVVAGSQDGIKQHVPLLIYRGSPAYLVG